LEQQKKKGQYEKVLKSEKQQTDGRIENRDCATNKVELIRGVLANDMIRRDLYHNSWNPQKGDWNRIENGNETEKPRNKVGELLEKN